MFHSWGCSSLLQILTQTQGWDCHHLYCWYRSRGSEFGSIFSTQKPLSHWVLEMWLVRLEIIIRVKCTPNFKDFVQNIKVIIKEFITSQFTFISHWNDSIWISQIKENTLLRIISLTSFSFWMFYFKIFGCIMWLTFAWDKVFQGALH
jgi:hypothetical protein